MSTARIRQNSACCCSPLFSSDVMPQNLEAIISVDEFATLMNDMNKIIKKNNPFSPQMWAIMAMTLGVAFCPMKRRLETNASEVNAFLEQASILQERGVKAKYVPPNGTYYGFVEFLFPPEESESDNVTQIS